MRHLAVAFAALFLIAFVALDRFDAPPMIPLVGVAAGPSVAMPSTPLAPRMHSGVLRSAEDFREIIPPARFEGDGAAVIIFGHAATIDKLCAGVKIDSAAAGPIACSGVNDHGTPIIIAPNPCLAADSELYAAILCHELGHLNGWPASHGD